ncbi:uncharacterized protein BJ171DRAFT_515031 [Polychytrium aggregatum]|uniref:uncharacterized protein n=1 Tax=Polychytrium aggregatum TaxID=110093 RepID=UPI0022FEE42D|nr:uncharacterized protein BJ171DRAFT_515031 [Polychytrium aggregatum]KAI9202150.1 hypothetical protein BJ171DRAFT_515031 [Polychytrium aggregatum]
MSSVSIRSRVLASYKELLRAQQVTFAGDLPQLRASRVHTRNEYIKNKDVADAAQLEQMIKVAQQAATIIRKNIVQGVKSSESEKFQIRIHEDTEINSNDTIFKHKREKMAKEGAAAPGCCGSQGQPPQRA